MKEWELIDVFMYAEEKHRGQTRKVSGKPYISHPHNVCKLLSQVTKDEEILAAGLLHDVIEDCDVTVEEIEYKFGTRVATLVLECTKPFDKLHSKEALMIKCADALHNASEQPSERWVQIMCDSVRYKEDMKKKMKINPDFWQPPYDLSASWLFHHIMTLLFCIFMVLTLVKLAGGLS